MKNLEKFDQLSDASLEEISGGTIIGYLAGLVVGAGGNAWGKMHDNNPGMPQSAIMG